MSFTLRNLFSEEDGEPGAELEPGEGESATRESAPAGMPTAASDGQAYLVSELLPFIPPAIAASGTLPMEKEVTIPIGKDGSSDVALSTIFQQCPELFEAEITPLNDSVVTLPLKLGKAKEPAKVGSSIFDAPGTPFGAPGFGLPPSGPSTGESAEAEENPFWSPDSGDDTPEPKESAKSPDAGFSAGFSDAPSKEVTQKDEGNAFGEPAAPKPEKETPPADPMAGFGAPAKPKSENPFGDPAPREEAEPKSSGFSENPFDSNESFSTLFSTKAEEDADIPFPGAGSDEASWGAMFDADGSGSQEDSPSSGETGLGEMMQKSDVNGHAAEETASKAEPFAPPKAEKAPEAEAAAEPEAEKIPEAAATPNPQMNPFGDTPSMQSEAKPEVAAAPVEEAATNGFVSEKPAADKTPVPPAEEVAPEPTPTTSESEKTFSPVREAVPTQMEAQVDEASLKVEEEQIGAVTKVPAMPGEMEVSVRDLEFRAVFSSDDSFTLAKVARKVVAFDGVSACALATPAKLVQASRNEQSRLGDEAREMVDAIRNLAKLTGLPEARAFTLQTDRGTVSLFLEGDCCVTVNHHSSGFGPGVREKLILIARNIHKLQE